MSIQHAQQLVELACDHRDGQSIYTTAGGYMASYLTYLVDGGSRRKMPQLPIHDPGGCFAKNLRMKVEKELAR